MNKLELELMRLDGFLIQIDKKVEGILTKEDGDLEKLELVFDIRELILNRLKELHKIQQDIDLWKNYKHPTPRY